MFLRISTAHHEHSLEQVSAFDTLVVPVGGGGLLAGLATVVKAFRPTVRIVAVEPEAAPSFTAARRSGRPTSVIVGPTIADGLAVARVGDLAFALAAALIDQVVTVNEAEVAVAVALLAQEAGAVVEGAGAAPLAAILAGKVSSSRVVLPVTGRNIDPRVHSSVVAKQREKMRLPNDIARAA